MGIDEYGELPLVAHEVEAIAAKDQRLIATLVSACAPRARTPVVERECVAAKGDRARRRASAFCSGSTLLTVPHALVRSRYHHGLEGRGGVNSRTDRQRIVA